MYFGEITIENAYKTKNPDGWTDHIGLVRLDFGAPPIENALRQPWHCLLLSW